MRFTVEQDDDIVIFTLKEERLDSLNSPDVKAELLIIGQPNVIGLIIDLSQITFCDSAGLSALLLAHRQMKEHEAPVILVGVGDQVRNLLRISQLEWLFDYFPTVEDALGAFENVEDYSDEE
ncbi:MAG: STAS domain-containing protein [Bacteroidetes bacterium]|nr:STAS domain-containing protein [Bacteroidota bacterium]